MRTLTWPGVTHSLDFIQTSEAGGGKGILHLRKAGGDQDIEFPADQCLLTEDQLEDAWKA